MYVVACVQSFGVCNVLCHLPPASTVSVCMVSKLNQSRSGETRYVLQPVTTVTRLVGTLYSVFVTLIVTRYWVAVEYAAALQSSALQAKRVVTNNE